MISTLLGIKKNMTSGYDARGRRVGLTIVEILPNFVTQIKTAEGKDGYSAVQLGAGVKKSVKKPQIGHAKKSGINKQIRWFREVREFEEVREIKPGTELKLDQVFSAGDSVKITGISKGKGFQGGVRRHGFAGGPKTHGQSDRHRAPGSIGSGTTPGRVLKGKRMAGHMGNTRSSVRNLEVVSIDKKQSLLMVKGAVPGFKGGLVEITRLGHIKGYTPPPEEKVDEEEVQKDSENSEDQTDNSDTSGTPKSSESSEIKGEENAGE